MKVIFIEDVPNIARVGQTKVVADGYARNYLLPRKLAVVADSQAASAVESQLKKKIKQRELEEAEMATLAEKINGIEITLKAKVGESEKLYGSITGADIAEELGKSAGHDIDKKKIELPEPIRKLGTYEVTIRFTHDITASISVTVASEEPVEEEAEKTEKKEKKTKAKAEPAAEEKPGEADKPAKKTRAKSTKKAKAAEAKAEESEVKVEETEVKAEEPETINEEAEAIEAEMDAKEK